MRKVKGTFYFKITGSDGTVQEWLVDLKNGNGSVTKNPGMHAAHLKLRQGLEVAYKVCVCAGGVG